VEVVAGSSTTLNVPVVSFLTSIEPKNKKKMVLPRKPIKTKQTQLGQQKEKRKEGKRSKM